MQNYTFIDSIRGQHALILSYSRTNLLPEAIWLKAKVGLEGLAKRLCPITH